MKIEDYFKYYIQGSDHYLIPKDVFEELFYDYDSFRQENKELKDNWNKLKEWLEERNKNTINIAYECDLDYVDVLDKMQEIEGGMNE